MRFVHHPAGHFHRGVVASKFATTAGLLGSYAHPAVAGRSGQAGAVPSDRDPGRRRNLGTGVARPSEGTHTRPEKTPRACGQWRAVPGYLFRGPPTMSDPAGNDDRELLRRALAGEEPALAALFDGYRERRRRMIRLRLDRRLSGRVDSSGCAPGRPTSTCASGSPSTLATPRPCHVPPLAPTGYRPGS